MVMIFLFCIFLEMGATGSTTTGPIIGGGGLG